MANLAAHGDSNSNNAAVGQEAGALEALVLLTKSPHEGVRWVFPFLNFFLYFYFYFFWLLIRKDLKRRIRGPSKRKMYKQTSLENPTHKSADAFIHES